MPSQAAPAALVDLFLQLFLALRRTKTKTPELRAETSGATIADDALTRPSHRTPD